MRGWWIAVVLVGAVGCGSDIKKGKTGQNSQNGEPNGQTGANNTTATNNLNNTVGANNTTIPNNTIGPVNNVNNRDWSTCFTDEDGDGYGVDEQMIDAPCTDVGLVWDGGDCDDTDPETNPDGSDVCDGVDRDCDGTWRASVPAVCPTIQTAIDAAAAMQTTGAVTVAPGMYRENLVFRGARVRVVGAGPTSTTIDGSGQPEAAVRFVDGESEGSVLEGFSVTGGRGHVEDTSRRGGGIYIYDASPTLRDLVVRNNRAEGDSGYGGGVSIARSSSLLERVDIVGNQAGYYGGGLHLSQSTATLRQVRLIDNRAPYGAGGVVYFSNATIDALVVARNSGTFGGGLFVQGESPVITNAAFVANTADEGGALSCSSACAVELRNVTVSANAASAGGALYSSSADMVVEYSNFWENGPNPFDGYSLGGQAGNIAVAPAFVTTAGDPRTWNLHLQASSPLIDAGDVALMDFDGTRSDIGAYGGEFGDW